MSFQKREIREPLLIMDNIWDQNAAIQMFRNLLSYMKVRRSSKDPLIHVAKFIRIALVSGPIVKDEAYLQVYKQLRGNKNYEFQMRALKFLAIMSSCFVPNNRDIFYLILNFLF